MLTGNRVLPGAPLPAARGLAAGRPVTAEHAIRAERTTGATRLPTSAAIARAAGERALSRPLPVDHYCLIGAADSPQAVPTNPGVAMHSHIIVTTAAGISSQGLVSYLQTLFGPLFLGIVGIVAIFFLFTREIIRFVQFFILAVAIAVIFYVPGIVRTLAMGIAHALGVH